MTSEISQIEDLSRWMTNLPPYLTTIPVCHLKIPGSHDSGADKSLSCKLPVANDEEGIVAFAGKIPRIRKGIKRWATTQRLSIEDQLRSGVRYFDFRVSYPPDRVRPKAGDFVLVHALYGPDLRQVLEKMRCFVDANPLEILIIDINHTFGLNQKSEHELKSVICQSLNPDILCPEIPPMLCSLAYLRNNGYKIIILMDQIDNTNQLFWSQKHIRSPWPNENRREILFQILENNLKNAGPDPMNIFYVTQCVLTARLNDVILHWWSTLEQQFSQQTMIEAIEWMKNLPTNIQKLLNIILSDSVCEEFCRSVIQLNYISFS